MNEHRLQRRLGVLALAVLAASAALLSACDDDDGGTATAPASTASPSAPATTASAPSATSTQGPDETPAEPTPGSGRLLIAEAAGEILTDDAGFTLYTFDADTAGSGESACLGVCPSIWPPLLVAGSPAPQPEIPGTVATITRNSGTTQLTYNGMPLYRNLEDTQPGQTNGDGLGGVWHVAVP